MDRQTRNERGDGGSELKQREAFLEPVPSPALWLPRFDHFCFDRWKIMSIFTPALMNWLKYRMNCQLGSGLRA